MTLIAECTLLMGASIGWPSWRGPDGQGGSQARDLPLKWSETQNVVWKTSIPGRGWSTPVIGTEQIWLTTGIETAAAPEDAERRLKSNTGGQPVTLVERVSLRAICVDRATGALEHDIELFLKAEPQWVHKDNTYASPSPILEEGRLYCHFGAYGTACVDTDTGDVLWRNASLSVMHENGPGGSPILWKDYLFLNCDGSDRQFVVALHKTTGEVVWKTERSGEMNANPQLKKSYGTCVVQTVNGVSELISTGSDWLYGYDLETGRELWKLSYGALGFSIVPKPVVRDEWIYLSTSFMRPQILAVRNEGNRAPEIAWRSTRGAPLVPSPLLIGEELYFVSDSGGILTCLDADTGQEHYRERMGGNYYASPIYADGRIYFVSREGKTSVIAVGTEFLVLAENELDGSIASSPAAVGRQLYLRTDQSIYRIEAK